MLLTLQEALQTASQKLHSVSSVPLLEAELLLAKALNQPRSFLYAWPKLSLDEGQCASLNEFVQRRMSKEPMAYITGKKEFWSLELEVNGDTLIPRPETELLVACILQKFNDPSLKVADLGTGSGAIALALASERPAWQVYATDIHEGALKIAKQNAKRLGLTNVLFYPGHWCEALPCADFDIIVSNPPYLSNNEWPVYESDLIFEPRTALVATEDGYGALRQIIQSASCYLKPRGSLYMEHGWNQGSQVRKLLETEGYKEILTLKDLSGHERLVTSKKGRS